MKDQRITQAANRNKTVSIIVLFAFSIAITLVGASFSVYSLINNVSFRVISNNVHGAIFGLVIAFLGIRYFLSVMKLKKEVYKTESQFSWSNFKRTKDTASARVR